MANRKNLHKLHVKEINVTLVGRPCELSAFSFIPTDRKTNTQNVFNTQKKESLKDSLYNEIFDQNYGYNEKISRCDRSHSNFQGINIHSEEAGKLIPSRSSSEYGHHLKWPLEEKEKTNRRFATIKTEFYRNNGLEV